MSGRECKWGEIWNIRDSISEVPNVGFNETNLNNVYGISTEYIHPVPECGTYHFDDRMFFVNGTDGDDGPSPLPPVEPTLEVMYDPLVYVAPGIGAVDIITASVKYPLGKGSLRINLTGPDKNLTVELVGESKIGIDEYEYEYEPIYFDSTNYNNTYHILPTYIHESLPGGMYKFRGRSIKVIPVTDIPVKNPRVIPENGSDSQLYDYCVDVETNLSRCDLELQTAPPGSDSWTSQEFETWTQASGNNTVCWRSKKAVDKSCLGEAKFRVLWSGQVLEEFDGPNVIVNYADKSCTLTDVRNWTLTCSVNVRSVCNSVPIELWYYNKDTSEYERFPGCNFWYNGIDEEWETLTCSGVPSSRVDFRLGRGV